MRPRAGPRFADGGVVMKSHCLPHPFGLSLSKPSLSYPSHEEGRPFDRLRANGVLQ
jgi:hypothetical protein